MSIQGKTHLNSSSIDNSLKHILFFNIPLDILYITQLDSRIYPTSVSHPSHLNGAHFSLNKTGIWVIVSWLSLPLIFCYPFFFEEQRDSNEVAFHKVGMKP